MSQNSLEQRLGFTPSNDLIHFLERGEERLRSGLSDTTTYLTRPNQLDKRYPPGTIVCYNGGSPELIIGNDGDAVLYTIAADFARFTWSEFETPRNKQRIEIIHRPSATRPDQAFELLHEFLAGGIQKRFATGYDALDTLRTIKHPLQMQALFLMKENRWLIACLWAWFIQNHDNPLLGLVVEQVITPGLNHRRSTFSAFERLLCEDMAREKNNRMSLRQEASPDEMTALRTIIARSGADPAALMYELRQMQSVGNRIPHQHRLEQVLSEQLAKK